MTSSPTGQIAGWGRHSVAGVEVRSEDLERASRDVPLSRGLGRSYGDASLPAADRPRALNTTLADRILGFDEQTGVLHAEAGLSLEEMNRLFLPRRWFTPVTPGTKYVTLGGMVASDVHGKGQHRQGCFGHHVLALRMRVADGRVLVCGPDQERELFLATVGGMGLTGHILEVTVRMQRVPSPWIVQRSERIPNLDAFLAGLERAAEEWPYTVGWIDCLAQGASMGRGNLISGRWATPEEAPADPPKPGRRFQLSFDYPSWVLNRASIAAFNELKYRSQLRASSDSVVDPEGFFYPLDRIRHWNRLYGTRGFTQYQCVLPREAGPQAVHRLMSTLTQRGGASFLAVIKDFGRDGAGMISFPRPGITLALDIPLRDDTQALVDALNQQVIADGGRVYLTKDSLTRADDFRRMDGARVDAFNAVRDRWDPERRFKSALSVRLLGDRLS
ncbi:MAG: FAD-binding oxidoreductase [Sandaracinaceae bacterium]|nr:FAD-binding oxidoreductase [Sandaracinaceae bacterium]MBP7682443.1 FAD-binding oxidoreductase [Deltaproteobacteria bacterium]